eukprot:TRINITY_DN80103_c0_g1_i1.p1 TRINITY_DN80103_c0_g1~~TRINITY_DN80103_c0_g1_i1.p1  ORF type:complete len:240 (+),score=31.14 TRINITY_DN80103_c0_g1_i1:54-773(+)
MAEQPVASIEGTWKTPLDVVLVPNEESTGVFQDEGGTLTLTLAAEDGSDTFQVTLQSGEQEISGTTVAPFDRICWRNGAVWIRLLPVTLTVLDETLLDDNGDNLLLNEGEVAHIVNDVNFQIDLWLLDEWQERVLLMEVVKSVNVHLRPALKVTMNDNMVDAVFLLANKAASPAEKQEQLVAILRQQLKDSLIHGLNEHIDIAFVPEGMEEKMLTLIIDKYGETILQVLLAGLRQSGLV